MNVGRNEHNVIAVDKSWSSEKSLRQHQDASGRHDRDRAHQGRGVSVLLQLSCDAGRQDGNGRRRRRRRHSIHAALRRARGPSDRRNSPPGVTRRVPQDYPTIQNGVDAANPGDLVLIDQGEYNEAVFVTTPSVTLRGVDRNAVILDGKFELATGIMVGGNGVAVENMTARNLHAQWILLDRGAGVSRLLPHRLQQRRLRHLCVRIERRVVRALPRERISGLGVLRRPMRALPRGVERCHRQLQRARLFRHEFQRRHVHPQFALRAQPQRDQHDDVRYRTEPAGPRHDHRRQRGERQRASTTRRPASMRPKHWPGRASRWWERTTTGSSTTSSSAAATTGF